MDVVEIHVRGPPPGRGGALTRPQDASAGVGKVLLQRLFNLELEQGAFKVPSKVALSLVLHTNYHAVVVRSTQQYLVGLLTD